EKSGIKRARAIVSALPTDAENVFIALTARNLCTDIQIIAKSEQGTSCRKLRQAGANKIVMPHRVGAQQMERMISRPTAADLIDLFAEASELEMELDEITVKSDDFLSGKAVKESNIKEEYGLLLVGIKKPDGAMLFNPAATYKFESKDVLLVMGRTDEIQRLQQRK
ncbi:MAG: NAD-binding protein, partial [Planctomycetota bacterium]